MSLKLYGRVIEAHLDEVLLERVLPNQIEFITRFVPARAIAYAPPPGPLMLSKMNRRAAAQIAELYA